MRPISLRAFNKLNEKTDPFNRREINFFKENFTKIFSYFSMLFGICYLKFSSKSKFNQCMTNSSKITRSKLITINIYYCKKIDLKTAFLFIVTSFKNIQYNKGNIINDSKIGCFQQFFSCIRVMIYDMKNSILPNWMHATCCVWFIILKHNVELLK